MVDRYGNCSFNCRPTVLLPQNKIRNRNYTLILLLFHFPESVVLKLACFITYLKNKNNPMRIYCVIR